MIKCLRGFAPGPQGIAYPIHDAAQFFTKRFFALGTKEQYTELYPAHGFAQPQFGDFRDTSPVNRAGEDRVEYRVKPEQHTESADTRGYIFLAPPIVPAMSKNYSQAQIDPFASLRATGEVFRPFSFDADGSKSVG